MSVDNWWSSNWYDVISTIVLPWCGSFMARGRDLLVLSLHVHWEPWTSGCDPIPSSGLLMGPAPTHVTLPWHVPWCCSLTKSRELLTSVGTPAALCAWWDVDSMWHILFQRWLHKQEVWHFLQGLWTTIKICSQEPREWVGFGSDGVYKFLPFEAVMDHAT